MVKYPIIATDSFQRAINKIKNADIQERIKKQIFKISEEPETGKPLRYDLKGARTLRVSPFRIIYAFKENKIYLLKFEHRGSVYG